MKAIGVIMLVLCGSLAGGAMANEASPLADDYEEFVESGVFDPELSNPKADEMVFRGISSDNQRIVELTVRAMGEHAMQRALEGAVVARSFSLVPGLHDFLTGYWHDNLDDFGGGAQFVPLILALYFPGDEEAYRIAWEYRAHGGGLGWTVLCLNAGRFRTDDADRLRIESLASDDFLTFGIGALGIAMSKPEKGLDAIVSSLVDNPLSATIPATRGAIAAYGADALPVLREAFEEGDLSSAAAAVVSREIKTLESSR